MWMAGGGPVDPPPARHADVNEVMKLCDRDAGRAYPDQAVREHLHADDVLGDTGEVLSPVQVDQRGVLVQLCDRLAVQVLAGVDVTSGPRVVEQLVNGGVGV